MIDPVEVEALLKRLMRSTVLCDALGIKAATAQRYRSRPDQAPTGFPVRWVKLGGQVWYDRADAEAYIAAKQAAKTQRLAQRGDTGKT